MTMLVTLRFENEDAGGDGPAEAVEFRVERRAVPAIMDWYGAFYAGDRYSVFINGREQALGINGEMEAPIIDAEPRRRRLPSAA